VNDTYGTLEVNDFSNPVSINNDLSVRGVDITGDLVVGTTNIITEIETKQDEITLTTDLTSNSITTIGGGTIGGNNDRGYNSSTGEYTIRTAGNW